MDRKDKRLGYTIAWVCSIGNIILFIFKYWIGLKVNSVAMKADAWHTLSDTLTSLIVIFSFWISFKKPDKDHPFGHGRSELIGTVIIGTVLILVGLNFLKESISRLQVYHIINFSRLSIIIFSFSILIKEGMALSSIIVGKKIVSRALIADGWHHRSDAITTVLIVIGALLGKYFWWLDSVLGLFISLFILYTTYNILKRTFHSLLGERSDPEVEKKIIKIIQKVTPGVFRFHHLHIHRYGDHAELTFHIRLPADLMLKKAHQIASLIEDKIRNEMNMEATIHVEPI